MFVSAYFLQEIAQTLEGHKTGCQHRYKESNCTGWLWQRNYGIHNGMNDTSQSRSTENVDRNEGGRIGQHVH